MMREDGRSSMLRSSTISNCAKIVSTQFRLALQFGRSAISSTTASAFPAAWPWPFFFLAAAALSLPRGRLDVGLDPLEAQRVFQLALGRGGPRGWPGARRRHGAAALRPPAAAAAFSL